VLETNNLYISCQNKLVIIKNNLEKNKNIIEENKENFRFETINNELVNMNKDIQCNKSFTNGKNTILLDLIAIPSHMINCFRNNCLSLYLEYYYYLMSLKSNPASIIQTLIKVCEKLNHGIGNLLIKMLRQNNNNLKEMNLEDINDILNLEINPILSGHNLSIGLRKINVILFQFHIYYDYFQINENSPIEKFVEFFQFFKEKLFIIKNETNENEDIIEASLNFIFDNYVHPTIQKYYFIPSSQYTVNKFTQRRNILCQYLLENNFTSLGKIEETINQNFYIFLDLNLTNNSTMIHRYLRGIKDIKKLLTQDNQDKYEVLVVLNNNLVEIYNIIIEEHCYSSLLTMSITHKYHLINKLNCHFDHILKILSNFFMDNCYIIKYDTFTNNSKQGQSSANELIVFKNQLFNFSNESGIIMEFLRDIYRVLGLNKYWELYGIKEIKNWSDSFLIDDVE